MNHYKFTGRSHLTAQLSTDDGATWNEGLTLDERGGPNFPNGVPGGVSYPDGVQDKDGLIWITYDRDRNGGGKSCSHGSARKTWPRARTSPVPSA